MLVLLIVVLYYKVYTLFTRFIVLSKHEGLSHFVKEMVIHENTFYSGISIMEEDIDELLEEVENKFINGNSDGKPRKFNKANIFSPQSSFTSSLRIGSTSSSIGRYDSSDYDDILRDVDDNIGSKSDHARSLKKEYTPVGSSANKCFPVYLGGSDSSSGCSTISIPRACNNLHCISCDFAVYAFDDFQWSSSTDYLFLRTKMPNFDHVKSNLIATDGCRAYACQCHHYSTSILQQVQSAPTLTWVCGSHSIKSEQL